MTVRIMAVKNNGSQNIAVKITAAKSIARTVNSVITAAEACGDEGLERHGVSGT